MSSMLIGLIMGTFFGYAVKRPSAGITFVAAYALVGVLLGGVVAHAIDSFRPRHEVAQAKETIYAATDETVNEWTQGEYKKFPPTARAVYTLNYFVLAISQGDRIVYRYFRRIDGRMSYMSTDHPSLVREENRPDAIWQVVCRKYLFEPHWMSFGVQILPGNPCREELVVPLGGIASERWPT